MKTQPSMKKDIEDLREFMWEQDDGKKIRIKNMHIQHKYYSYRLIWNNIMLAEKKTHKYIVGVEPINVRVIHCKNDVYMMLAWDALSVELRRDYHGLTDKLKEEYLTIQSYLEKLNSKSRMNNVKVEVNYYV